MPLECGATKNALFIRLWTTFFYKIYEKRRRWHMESLVRPRPEKGQIAGISDDDKTIMTFSGVAGLKIDLFHK